MERVLDSYADVIADPEVEAIYNPLANGLHAPWNQAALLAGKHVLTEKPFASNAVEAATVRSGSPYRTDADDSVATHGADRPLLPRDRAGPPTDASRHQMA